MVKDCYPAPPKPRLALTEIAPVKKTLRDEFAIALLNGLAASGRIPYRTTHQTTMEDDEERAYEASEIYAMVDALMEARDK
jgi:hypothetical protein